MKTYRKRAYISSQNKMAIEAKKTQIKEEALNKIAKEMECNKEYIVGTRTSVGRSRCADGCCVIIDAYMEERRVPQKRD